jgi:hypothetical protein
MTDLVRLLTSRLHASIGRSPATGAERLSDGTLADGLSFRR